MSDVLSQSEIDNLLAALSSGELDAEDYRESGKKQVRKYDFLHPSKFSKEQLRTLESIFEHYGRLLSTNLPAYLRKNVQVEVVNAEAQAYSEFTNSLANPVLLGVIDFAPLDGNIIIELAENLGFAMVDRMLGGLGVPLSKSREFSEIELTIIERIFTVFTDLLREPWANVIDLDPRLIRIETNPQFAQIISPNEMTSIVTINIKLGTVEGLMNVCLPYACLETVMDKLNMKYWYSTMKVKDDQSYDEMIQTAIIKAEIPVRAVLGSSIISVNDFIQLQAGDVIKLSTKVEDELNVYVGNMHKFTALPGSSGGAYAVKIASIIREE